ncbi:MAG TPA: hydroxyacid dehydrogenase [Acidimicrobiales bacterium]|nr:hydroxyacid dehydrogenase [Acidimicrobiales bacterium]
MADGLETAAFADAHRARLAVIGDVVASGGDAEVLLGHWGCPRLDEATLASMPSLRLFAYAAGTVKEIVTPAVWARGIVVTSAAAANAVPVAEYTLAAILFANKGVLASRERLRATSDVRIRRPRPLGNVAKRVGLIGASLVGRRVIELLRPFDLEVVVADPYLDDAEAERLGVTRVELGELVATSDIVSVHAPNLPSTRHLIGPAQLGAMRDGATLVNTARGAIVDTDALVEALRDGRISAVLDVTDPEPLPPDHPLLSLPNAFVTPHVAGAQGSELGRLADLAITEIERFVAGAPPLHPVNERDLERMA